jgi:hypothetical protein
MLLLPIAATAPMFAAAGYSLTYLLLGGGLGGAILIFIVSQNGGQVGSHLGSNNRWLAGRNLPCAHASGDDLTARCSMTLTPHWWPIFPA